MPILAREPDMWPQSLFEQRLPADGNACWWVFYTLSRREKSLSRRLLAGRIPFYAPVVPKRINAPNGRVRTSYKPLFPNYVFMFGTDEQRYWAMTTNCVSRWMRVHDGQQLAEDLRRIWQLIRMGTPMTVEARITPGQQVRVRTGPFAGFEGIVVRRCRKTHLLVCVHFINQAVSIELTDCQLEPI
ncbi:MAG TPA: antitermination protein NusG [Planctomycetaceae bacterium]|nr:antitermination protein NusG [Planctomycetaceae bacterium]